MRALFIFLVIILSAPAHAYDAASWRGFLGQIKREAVAQGVSSQVADRAFVGLKFDASVISKDRKQPEKTITFAQYRKNVINTARIETGRRLFRENAALLQRLEERFGVQGQYMVALWGMESDYGRIQGKHELVTALASLAYEGRRRDFFKKELINTLKIMQDQNLTRSDMLGSWAGAMGMVQFMPSSYLSYAADGDGDGHKDIWGSKTDALASAANYLAKNGWQPDLRWGRAVTLPANFPSEMIGRKVSRQLSLFAQMGVKPQTGGILPSENIDASIVAPDGRGGPAFIVYANYHVIMDWNRSDYFATSVGILADAIAQ